MSSGILVSQRFVRSVAGSRHRVPWPNMRRHTGITKTGSRYDERQRWPAAMAGSPEWSDRQQHYYSEIMPRVNDTKDERAKVYTDVQAEHYVHPVTGEMVYPPEMTVEIIAPNPGHLAATKLRPYVSYRVEEEIEKLLIKEPPQWPPVRCSPTLLYDMHYRQTVADGGSVSTNDRHDKKNAK